MVISLVAERPESHRTKSGGAPTRVTSGPEFGPTDHWWRLSRVPTVTRTPLGSFLSR